MLSGLYSGVCSSGLLKIQWEKEQNLVDCTVVCSVLVLVGHRTAASAGELDTVGGKQEHRNKLNANSCDTVGFGAA